MVLSIALITVVRCTCRKPFRYRPFGETQAVSNALVQVEEENGVQLHFAGSGIGKLLLQKYESSPAKRYRLSVVGPTMTLNIFLIS